MRSWKRASKSVQNFEQTQPTVGASSSRGQSSSRTPNWTECMDSILLGLLREEHTLGNNINGTFTNLAWKRVVKEYNTKNNMDLTKDQIKNRLKVLKRTFALYNCLANKSGWGWDYENNIPTPGDNEDWQAIIADNPAYLKCRDKPFPQYTDLEFLTQKQTATGRYGFTSIMETPETVDSSSSSSPGENETSVPPMSENHRPPNSSRSPSPAPMDPNLGAGGSGSGHSSAGKRPRSPRGPSSNRGKVPSAGGRRPKIDPALETFSKMVAIGEQKLDLVRQMYQVEITKRANIATIEECMARVYSFRAITDQRVMAAAEALKDEQNRQVFMTMNDEHAIMWLDRQVAKDSLMFRHYFPGM